MKKSHWNRKGFTVTELTIAMAIAAIVGVMITTTLALTTTQKKTILDGAEFISEVTDIQIRVNEWLKKYDNISSVITTAESGGSIKVYRESALVGTLSFANGALTADGSSISKTYTTVTSLTFEVAEQIPSETPGEAIMDSLVIVNVHAEKGAGENIATMEQTLIYPLFSGKTRNRIVPGKGNFN